MASLFEERLVKVDLEGRAYCGRCGATRNADQELFQSKKEPHQAVRGHLKTCRGRRGVEEDKALLAARLTEPGPVLPDREPAAQPAESARQQPVASRWQPAVSLYKPVSYRPMLGAPPQPAGAYDQRLADLEAQVYDLRDQVTLSRQESERYREIAQDALALAGNHEPHLALAAAENASVSPVLYVLGGIAAAGVLGWALGLFGGNTEVIEPKMGSRNQQQSASRANGGLGDLLSTGSQIASLVKNVRGALRL